MIYGLAALLVFDVVGEWLARVSRVPLPGPVIGLALLLCGLMLARRSWPGLERASDLLLRHLSLFFVPATVGALVLLPSLAPAALPLLAALVLSTLLGLGAAAGTFQLLARRRPDDDQRTER